MDIDAAMVDEAECARDRRRFRFSFRVWCGDTGVAREVAEAALAHVVRNKVEAAYARGTCSQDVARSWRHGATTFALGDRMAMKRKAGDLPAAEYLQRAAHEPRSDEARERQQLDFMCFIIQTVTHDRHSIARYQARRLRRHPEEWMSWIQASKSDTLAWDTLQALVGELLDLAPGALMCSPLAVWSAEAIAGKRPRRSPMGPDPFENLMYDIAVCVAIEEICAIGRRKATTSNAHRIRRRNRRSACELVAERLDLKYKSVEGIWGKDPGPS